MVLEGECQGFREVGLGLDEMNFGWGGVGCLVCSF